MRRQGRGGGFGPLPHGFRSDGKVFATGRKYVHLQAALMSVCEKSLPLNSRGSPVRVARA